MQKEIKFNKITVMKKSFLILNKNFMKPWLNKKINNQGRVS